MAGPLTLALETSGSQSSLALADGERVLLSRELLTDRAHSTGLFPELRSMLADAGFALRAVELFAFSAGPGSFTGLRIAATVGRMLHSAVGCRVVAVPTLEVIAFQATAAAAAVANIAALLDAKQGRVYGAVFESGEKQMRCVVEPAVREIAWLDGVPRPMTLTGPGVGVNREACAAFCEKGEVIIAAEGLWRPRAASVALIGVRRAAVGRVCGPEEIVPLYVRPPECEEVYEQRRAEARARRGE